MRAVTQLDTALTKAADKAQKERKPQYVRLLPRTADGYPPEFITVSHVEYTHYGFEQVKQCLFKIEAL